MPRKNPITIYNTVIMQLGYVQCRFYEVLTTAAVNTTTEANGGNYVK